MLDRITINTHSSIRIDAGKILYFDPFRLENDAHDADVIFFTHSHFDHFSPEDIEKAAGTNTLFAAPAGMQTDLQKAGIPLANCILLAPEQTVEICGIPVETVPSYNIGKPMHPKKNGWLGYVITADNTRIYIGGDMDATPEAATVQCDIAMLPIGGTYTMNAKEAAALVNAMQPKTAIPTHYGTIVGSKKDAETFSSLVEPSIAVCLKL